MATVTADNPVELSHNWGVSFSEYLIGGKKVDFQDLMIAIAENRATTVEGEVSPLTTRIKARNAYLEELGAALADLTKMQASFGSDAKGTDPCDFAMSAATKATIKKVTGNDATDKEFKMWVEYYIQRIKSKIDGLNNEAQTDMTRLQSLVDRRDESFSTATTLMTSISDTRGNLINNL